MRSPRLLRWKQIEQTTGALILAQRLEEALFDYSLDTYRVPALNTHTRAKELSRAIDDVVSGRGSTKSIRPIVEELAASVHDDVAAKALAGPLVHDLAAVEWWKVGDLRALDTQCDMLLGILGARQYEQALVQQIRVRIDDAQRKDDLLALVTNLLVEWIDAGFSRDYLFYRTKGFFFGPSGPSIQTNEAFFDFVKTLEPAPRKFSVVISTGVGSPDIDGVFPGSLVAIAKAPPAAQSSESRERKFLARSGKVSWLVFNDIEALDARAASEYAKGTVDTLVSIASLHLHRQPIRVDGETLVYGDRKPVVLKPSMPAIHREHECTLEELPDAFQRTLRTLAPPVMGAQSWTRFLAALGLHSSAIGSSELPVQLTTLWAAVEALLPIAAEDVKIQVVSEALVPALARGYPLKLISDLAKSLRDCVPEAFADVEAQLPEFETDTLKCAAALCVETNEPLRDILYKALERNPLLRHRVFWLKKYLSRGHDVLHLVEAHTRRVEWHIRRIYRGRNLVIHSGHELPYLPSLVEHLHSYFHRLIDAIEQVSGRGSSGHTIDSALLTVQLQHKSHLDFLQRFSDKSASKDDVRGFVHGPYPWTANGGATPARTAIPIATEAPAASPA